MVRVRVKVKLAVFKNRSDSTKAQPLVSIQPNYTQ